MNLPDNYLSWIRQFTRIGSFSCSFSLSLCIILFCLFYSLSLYHTRIRMERTNHIARVRLQMAQPARQSYSPCIHRDFSHIIAFQCDHLFSLKHERYKIIGNLPSRNLNGFISGQILINTSLKNKLIEKHLIWWHFYAFVGCICRQVWKQSFVLFFIYALLSVWHGNQIYPLLFLRRR